MEGGGGGIKGWMERMNGGREEEKAMQVVVWEWWIDGEKDR